MAYLPVFIYHDICYKVGALLSLFYLITEFWKILLFSLLFCECLDMHATACVWGEENNFMEFFLSFRFLWSSQALAQVVRLPSKRFTCWTHPAGPGILYVHAFYKSVPTILKQVFSNPLLVSCLCTYQQLLLTILLLCSFYCLISVNTPLLVIH